MGIKIGNQIQRVETNAESVKNSTQTHLPLVSIELVAGDGKTLPNTHQMNGDRNWSPNPKNRNQRGKRKKSIQFPLPLVSIELVAGDGKTLPNTHQMNQDRNWSPN